VDSGRYDREAREQLTAEATGILAPQMMLFGNAETPASPEQRESYALLTQFMQNIYFNHRKEAMEGFRRAIAQLLEYQPGVFRGMPKFQYEMYEIADRDIRITDRGNGRLELNVLATPLLLDLEIKRTPL